MVKEGFVSEEHVDHIIVESDVTKLLDRVPNCCLALMMLECD